MEAFLLIVLVIAVLAFFFNGMQLQSKQEVVAQGGLRNVFYNLDCILLKEQFRFHSDEVKLITYRRDVDQYSYVKLTLRKNLSIQDPYEIQMFHVVTGEVQLKTIPYLILPHHTDKQLNDCLIRMLHEMASKMGKEIII